MLAHDILDTLHGVLWCLPLSVLKKHPNYLPAGFFNPSVHKRVSDHRATGVAGETLKVLSWNIRQGRDAKAVLEVLEDAFANGLDVALLQEVPRYHGRRFQDHKLFENTDWVYAPDEFYLQEERWMSEPLVHAGNLIVSRVPLRGRQVVDLPITTWNYHRHRIVHHNALRAQVYTPQGAVRVLNTHLTIYTHPQHRAYQVAHALHEVPSGRAIIGMDANTIWRCLGPLQGLWSRLDDRFLLHTMRMQGFVNPCGEGFALPPNSLDHIMARDVSRMDVSRLDVSGSDHNPVYAEVHL